MPTFKISALIEHRVVNVTSLLLAVAFASSTWFFWTNLGLEANGSVRSYEKKIVGFYEIGFGTVPPSPRPGVIHFAVYVEDTDNKVRYTDATVVLYVVGNSSEGQPVSELGPHQMVNTLLDPTYYELNMPLDTQGVWHVRIEVIADKGEVNTVFEVKVLETNPIIPILTLVVLLLFLLVLSMSVRAWIKEYRRKNNR